MFRYTGYTYTCICVYTHAHNIRTYIHTYIDTYIHTYMNDGMNLSPCVCASFVRLAFSGFGLSAGSTGYAALC